METAQIPLSADTKAELVLDATAQDGFLLTQPASPRDGDEELSMISLSPGPSVVQGTPSAAALKRPIQIPSVLGSEQTDPGNGMVKRRKVASKASTNALTHHPWDCTGLVPRYQDYSDVPKELAKCECCYKAQD